MESRFGHNFGRVRVHADARAAESAQEVGALAYTVGNNVVFGTGRYAPTTAAGKKLLAHELAHVVQQEGATPTMQTLRIDGAPASAPEREAERAGKRVASGGDIKVRQRIHRPVLQGYFLSTEPAGGCGVCYGHPRFAGEVAHRIIQQEFEILYPGHARVEVPVSSATDENGRLDLAIRTGPAEVEIGEIKPANEAGYTAGIQEIAFYLEILESMLPNVTIRPLRRPITPAIFPKSPRASPTCPVQEIIVNPPVNGVYGYYCEPPFSRLVGRADCRCRRGDEDDNRERMGAEARQSLLAIIELASELRGEQGRFQRELVRSVGRVPGGSEYVIIAPPLFFEKFVIEPWMNRTVEPMRVHGMDARRNPVIGFRNLGILLVGLYAGSMAVVFYGTTLIGLAGGGVAAGGATATGTGMAAGGGGAEVISLAAVRAAATSEPARRAAQAAGVLLVVSVAERASADEVRITSIETVRAVPADSIEPAGAQGMGEQVTYGGQIYHLIGRARAR